MKGYGGVDGWETFFGFEVHTCAFGLYFVNFILGYVKNYS